MGMCKAITRIICLTQSIHVPDTHHETQTQKDETKQRQGDGEEEGRQGEGDCNFTAVSEDPAEAPSFH